MHDRFKHIPSHDVVVCRLALELKELADGYDDDLGQEMAGSLLSQVKES